MLKTGEIRDHLKKNGYVCVVDDYNEIAVRLENDKSGTRVFGKHKGREEFRSILSEPIVHDTITDLSNRIVTGKEYDEY